MRFDTQQHRHHVGGDLHAERDLAPIAATNSGARQVSSVYGVTVSSLIEKLGIRNGMDS